MFEISEMKHNWRYTNETTIHMVPDLAGGAVAYGGGRLRARGNAHPSYYD